MNADRQIKPKSTCYNSLFFFFFAAHLHQYLIDRPLFSLDLPVHHLPLSHAVWQIPDLDQFCLWSCCDGYFLCSGFHSFSPVCARACVWSCQHWNAFEPQTIRVIWQHYDIRKWLWAVFPRPWPFGCWTFSFHSMWSLFVYVRHTSGHKYGINVLPNANRHTLTQYQSYTLTWIRNKLNWNVSQ